MHCHKFSGHWVVHTSWHYDFLGLNCDRWVYWVECLRPLWVALGNQLKTGWLVQGDLQKLMAIFASGLEKRVTNPSSEKKNTEQYLTVGEYLYAVMTVPRSWVCVRKPNMWMGTGDLDLQFASEMTSRGKSDRTYLISTSKRPCTYILLIKDEHMTSTGFILAFGITPKLQ
jgi:hypothetical protein